MLCGQLGSHIQQIEERLNVEIKHRSNVFYISGSESDTRTASLLLHQLYRETENSSDLSPNDVHLAIRAAASPTIETPAKVTDNSPTQKRIDNSSVTQKTAVTKNNSSNTIDQAVDAASIIKTKKCSIKPRGENQIRYTSSVRTHDINFGIGPAGTGKTYLAVACAVQALLEDEIERILLVRPAVEAGEKLGFLPGDLAQKVDPYLRPLYDALYEMLGFETVVKLIERNTIEVAPLAYMRGRTLNNAFVILDESQNTTKEQMKMFLTRIGFGSTAVITGDPTQVDLPKGTTSGLRHAASVLEGVEGVSFTNFSSKDVVRHPIVQRVVDAYARAEQGQNDNY